MTPPDRVDKRPTSLCSASLSVFGDVRAPSFVMTGGLDVGLRPLARSVALRVVIVVLVTIYLLRFMAVIPPMPHGFMWLIG